MNKSPSSLKDLLILSNTDISNFPIAEFNDNYYVSESLIDSFIEEYGLSDDKDYILSIIKESNSLDRDIIVIDESATDADLIFIKDFMTLYESLNPMEVVKVSKGRGLLKQFIEQAAAIISGNEYDNAAEIQKYIDKCDSVLEDIKEERKVSKEKIFNNDSYKFSLMYIWNIAKTVFITFFVPSVLSNSNIKWPKVAEKIFIKDQAKSKGAKFLFKKLSPKAQKVAGKVLMGTDFVLSTPDDLKGLYLSFADYDKLLDLYEKQIKKVRRDLVIKLNKIERQKSKGNMTMFELKEDCMEKDVEVHFQTPEDLKIKSDQSPEIVHDDDNRQMESPTPELRNEKLEPEKVEEPLVSEVEPPEEMISPIDAINRAKCDPCNVVIAKYGDKYYVDHKDLKCYMDACGETKYEAALANIINAHNDPNLSETSIKIIMGKNDLTNLDEDTLSEMRESTLDFEVYE